MDMIQGIVAVFPVFGVIATAWFGYKASVAGNLSKKQYEELSKDIGGVKGVVDSNKTAIQNITETLQVHDDSHLTTMYYRLEREMKADLDRGYTSAKNYDLISRMHKNYKALGGNGYIDRLHEAYEKLEIKE